MLGGDHAREVEDSRYLGGEVPAAGEDLGGGAVGDDDAVAHQDDALGEGGGELDVVGGDERGRRRGRRGRRSGQRGRPCGLGPCRGSARRGRPGPAARSPSIRPASAIASASRWRSPPERSRGSASTACSKPTIFSAASPASPGSSSPRAPGPGSRSGSGSAGRFQPGVSTLPRTGSIKPAAVLSSVLLPAPLRPMRATRSPRSTLGRLLGGRRGCSSPRASSTQRSLYVSALGSRGGGPPPLSTFSVGRRRLASGGLPKKYKPFGGGPPPLHRSGSLDARVRRASRTPTGRGSMPAREKRRAAGVSRAGSALGPRRGSRVGRRRRRWSRGPWR